MNTEINVIFPEKEDLVVRLDLEEGGNTVLSDIAEVFEEKFKTGSDLACYFQNLTSKPGEYLDNNKTLEEHGVQKSGGYKLLGYIKPKGLLEKPVKSTFLPLNRL